MARHLIPLLAAAAPAVLGQAINGTQVFAFYALATTGPPAAFGGELYSWCGLGPPYCDMARPGVAPRAPPMDGPRRP